MIAATIITIALITAAGAWIRHTDDNTPYFLK